MRVALLGRRRQCGSIIDRPARNGFRRTQVVGVHCDAAVSIVMCTGRTANAKACVARIRTRTGISTSTGGGSRRRDALQGDVTRGDIGSDRETGAGELLLSGRACGAGGGGGVAACSSAMIACAA